jgi:hypothetical protein
MPLLDAAEAARFVVVLDVVVVVVVVVLDDSRTNAVLIDVAP